MTSNAISIRRHRFRPFFHFSTRLVLAAAIFAFGLHQPSPSLAGDFEAGKRLFEMNRFEEALPKLLPLANAGNLDAQYMVGDTYAVFWLQGKEGFRSKAECWLEKATRRGHLAAKSRLGSLLEVSPTTDARSARGRRLIQEAAEAGDSFGQYRHGFYLAGDRDATPAVRRQGLAYMEKAAIQGDRRGIGGLSHLHSLMTRNKNWATDSVREHVIETIKWVKLESHLYQMHSRHDWELLPKALRDNSAVHAEAYSRAVAWLLRHRPEMANSLPVKAPWEPVN